MIFYQYLTSQFFFLLPTFHYGKHTLIHTHTHTRSQWRAKKKCQKQHQNHLCEKTSNEKENKNRAITKPMRPWNNEHWEIYNVVYIPTKPESFFLYWLKLIYQEKKKQNTLVIVVLLYFDYSYRCHPMNW